MREQMKKLEGQRLKFLGTFKRVGGGKDGLTLLLTDVRLNKEVITNHAWLRFGKRFKISWYKTGDVIGFWARITEYTKTNSKIDYRFSYPSKIEIYKNGDGTNTWDRFNSSMIKQAKKFQPK